MKTRIAMLISVAGVLAAGSAAALVNTQVLGGSGSSPQAIDSPAQSAGTTPVTAATTPLATTPAATTPAATTPAAQAPVSTQAVYSIGDAGTVTLDTAGDVLAIVTTTPADGWIVTKAETDGASNAEVKFQSGTIEIEFRANLLFGVVTTSVESNDTSASSTSVDDNGGVSGSGRHSGGSDDSGGGSDD